MGIIYWNREGRGKKRFTGGKNQKFDLVQVKSETPTRHPSGDISMSLDIYESRSKR